MDYFQKNSGDLLVTGVVSSLKETLRKAGLYDVIGGENLFDDAEDAIVFAKLVAGIRPAERRNAVKGTERFV